MKQAPFWKSSTSALYVGDARDVLSGMPASSADCIVTSPPYWGKRDYGVAGQYGNEPDPAAYVETLRETFAEARRVLANDGTCWLNLGDSYSAGRTRELRRRVNWCSIRSTSEKLQDPLRGSLHTSGGCHNSGGSRNLAAVSDGAPSAPALIGASLDRSWPASPGRTPSPAFAGGCRGLMSEPRRRRPAPASVM
jgi:hypothetical protein